MNNQIHGGLKVIAVVNGPCYEGRGPVDANKITLENGVNLFTDRSLYHHDGKYKDMSIIGMSLEEAIIKVRPVIWCGLNQFYGFRIGSPKGEALMVESIQLPNYYTRVTTGRGYSGGHVSQADFRTYPAQEIEGAIHFDQTCEGQTSGYYPKVVNLVKKVYMTILCGHKDLAGTIPVYKTILV